MRRLALTPLLALALGARANAQAPAPKPPAREITLEAGYVAATGNTNISTFSFGDKVILRWGDWAARQEFLAIFGTESGVESANQQRLALRADRVVNPRFSWVATGNYERNPFAGLARRFDEGVGGEFTALTDANDKLTFLGTFGLVQSLSTTDSTANYATANIATRYRHTFAEKTWFEQSIETVENLRETADLRINSESAVVAKLSGKLGLKLGYLVRYAARPVPGFKRTDTLFTSGLQLTF